ncbi:hypothetical protein H0H81_012558 [Sphagnurus paluster]|uniref:MYND-type domain-containing protein n=1 Tax=Sphagnurus paluster TaxID=117069 RepID=A0A9P7FTW8_9AGAR|nr:hypothetical protein H0H81_012558 [Sphagnurus paluster]
MPCKWLSGLRHHKLSPFTAYDLRTHRISLEKAEDLCRKRKPEKALPYLIKAIEENPENLDAAIQFAFLNEINGALQILEGAEKMGELFSLSAFFALTHIGRLTLKKILGDDCFEDSGDCVGHFWGIIETRPYMRVLQALVRVYYEADRPKDSEKTIIEMLRLCPGDNMGQRSWLGSMLIRNGRYSEAIFFAHNWLVAFKDGSTPPRGGAAFDVHPTALIGDDLEKDLASWGEGALLRTAALAWFKLSGDCIQSRQYLRLAVQAQPNILLKVLALVPPPKELNMSPRSRNGPEEAHDYLWLTQDLWMYSEVWDWANENPDVLEVLLKKCSREECDVREAKVAQFKRCAACHLHKVKKAIPYIIEALRVSPNNLDAAIQCAYVSDREGAVEILEMEERTGKETLKVGVGRDCFEDTSRHAGNFWMLIDTRSYIRVMQALVRIYFEEGRYLESEATMIEMLRLCPRDNTAQRSWLASMLIRNGRAADALCFAQSWFKHETPPRGGTIFTAPSWALLSAARAEELSRKADGNILHTAALAAFKLYGDCPQSQQLLKMAAYGQPHILTKVLGLATRPDKLNMDPREPNGHEDGHDHLWLSQDLWMEDAVWAWTNTNQDVKDAALARCDQCNRRETKVAQFERCAGCRIARYCSPECQKQDWKVHKPGHQSTRQQMHLIHGGNSPMGKNTMISSNMFIFNRNPVQHRQRMPRGIS